MAQLPAVKHGRRYEPEAVAYYEQMEGELCVPFGLKMHDEIPWLGASPDGITASGVVLEVKCPYTRPITPVKRAQEHHAQLQITMEVFDLDHLDFVQYKPAGRGPGRAGVLWDGPGYLQERVLRDKRWFAQNRPVLEAFIGELEKAHTEKV